MAKARRKAKRRCGYCGAPATTRDHIPPSSVFPSPRPSDLITVPSCEPCNNIPSDDEEYLVNVLLSDHRAEGGPAEVLREQRFSLERTPRRLKMAHSMLAATDIVDLFTPAGVHVGRRHRLTIDVPRLERVMCKLLRGLYFHEFREHTPSDRVSRTFLDPDPATLSHPAAQYVLVKGAGRKVGGDAFEYRIAKASDQPATALCIMLFYQRLLVSSWLMRP